MEHLRKIRHSSGDNDKVAKLKDSIEQLRLPYHISITRLKYVNHWHNPKLRINPYSNVFAYKVKAYAFEKEVRVNVDRFHDDFDATIMESGMPIKVSFRNLMRSIVVGPEAPPWFLELITSVTRKYGIKAHVRRSKLAAAPP